MLNMETCFAQQSLDAIKNFDTPGYTKSHWSQVENAVTAMLDILREYGIAAMGIWLLEKGRNHEIRGKLLDAVEKLFNSEIGAPVRGTAQFSAADPTKMLKSVQQVTATLEDTLFSRSILEQFLVYARHWAKYYKKKAGG